MSILDRELSQDPSAADEWRVVRGVPMIYRFPTDSIELDNPKDFDPFEFGAGDIPECSSSMIQAMYRSKTFKIHPAADIFPMMEGAAYDSLKASIEKDGQVTPIELWDGQVIDGRNRLKACEELGVDPWVSDVEDIADSDPVSYALALNLERRHLNESQRAMVASKAEELYRQDRPKDQEGKFASMDQPAGQASDRAASVMGVSGRSVRSATKVRRDGDPELAKSVERGDLAVSAAAKAVDVLTKPEQRKAAKEGGGAAVKAAVKEKLKRIEPEAGYAERMIRAFQNVVSQTANILNPAFENKWEQFFRKAKAEPHEAAAVDGFLKDLIEEYTEARQLLRKHWGTK